LETISDSAFSNCTFANINIPDTVKTISRYAFKNCNNLEELVLPTNLEYDTYQLMGLETLIIPEGIMYVEDPVQYGGEGLGFQHIKRLKLPSTLVSMEDKYLSMRETLSEIDVDPKNAIFSSNNGVLYSKDGKRLIIYPAGKRQSNYVVPSTVETIDNYAIYTDDYVLTEDYYGIPKGERACCLDAVAIPSSVLEIEDNAINCYQFKDFIIYGYDNSVAKEYADTHDNIQFKDINEFPGGNPYGGASHTDMMSATYSDGEAADINSVMTLKTKVNFTLTSPYTIELPYTISARDKIYVRKISDDSSIANISVISEYNNEPSLMPNVYGNWDISYGKINITLFMDKIDFEANTQYYFDLSEVTINDHIHSRDYCRKNYSFTSGYVVSKDMFYSFENEPDDFFTLSEIITNYTYIITDEFYSKEIVNSTLLYDIFNKREGNIKNFNSQNQNWIDFLSSRIRAHWNGSCFGMSSTVVLSNNSNYYNFIPNNSLLKKSIYEYVVPKYSSGISYGIRDIVNYYQVLYPFTHCNNININSDGIKEIYNKAKDIRNSDEFFVLIYGGKTSEGKTFCHAVVVLGGDNEKLYIYDPDEGATFVSAVIYEENGAWIYKSQQSEKIILNSKCGLGYESPINFITLEENLLNSTKVISAGSEVNIYSKIGEIFPLNCGMIPSGDDVEWIYNLSNENYYEIMTINNTLDCSIVNDSMYFAAKADKAEKTIVDAENGIQLINADGSYELTVAVDDMPYDMFDISGKASGDVVCEYTNNGVLVNTDNTSDTIVTIWNGLDMTDYTVPEKYDSFIVGEKNEKETILVDTDSNGTFETDIVGTNTPVISGTITLPSSDKGSVNLELLDNSGKSVKSTTSSNGKFSFTDIPNGNYTLRVSKSQYVTRDYKITIGSSPLSLAIKIHKYGDVNGDGVAGAHDATQILKYDVGVDSIFTSKDIDADTRSYLLIVGCIYRIINNNAVLSPADATQILRHEVGMTSLYDKILFHN